MRFRADNAWDDHVWAAIGLVIALIVMRARDIGGE
jgi:hypothetical protein